MKKDFLFNNSEADEQVLRRAGAYSAFP